jgi:DNA-binding transcriptional MocR family regulator
MVSAAEGNERNFRAGLSRTRGAYLALRDRISRGEFRPGVRFPGEPTLAAELGVSRVTLRHALDRLEAEGLVERSQKVYQTSTRLAEGIGKLFKAPALFASDARAMLDSVKQSAVDFGSGMKEKIGGAFSQTGKDVKAALG